MLLDGGGHSCAASPHVDKSVVGCVVVAAVASMQRRHSLVPEEASRLADPSGRLGRL